LGLKERNVQETYMEDLGQNKKNIKRSDSPKSETRSGLKEWWRCVKQEHICRLKIACTHFSAPPENIYCYWIDN
jgi:hypothetical protein